MTITYVNDLRLSEMATGDNSGTWGNVTNTNLELVGEALGFGTQQVFASDADATTTVLDGASDPARAMYFKVTSGASLSATRTMTIAPNTISRVMFIENTTTGSQDISVKQGSGAQVTIPNGAVKMVYLDGAGSGAAVTDGLIDLNMGGSLTVGGDLTVNGDTITFTSANSSDPILKLINTTNDTNGAEIHLRKDKGAAGADGDIVGLISFIGDDAAQQQHIFAKMEASIATAADGSEGGKLILGVATHDAEFQNGLVLQDGNAEDEIDVTIASGTSSVTNIVGSLGVGTSSPDRIFTINNGGPVVEIDPAGQSSNPIYFNYNRSTSAYLTPQYWALGHKFMYNGGTDGLVIDSSGRLGVHTTPNAWETGTGGRVPIQIGFGSFSGRINDSNMEISNNCYATGTGNDPQWAGISRYHKQQMEFDNAGSIIFKHAATVDASTFSSSPNFTWTERVEIDSSGNTNFLTDSAALRFGADKEVTLTHVHNKGLELNGQFLVGASSADSHIKILSAGTNATNYIALRNTTAADTSGARFSYLNFEGTQSGGEISTLASVGAQHEGTADDEKGYLAFTTNDGNDGDSPTERMRITSLGVVTIQGDTLTTNLQLNGRGSDNNFYTLYKTNDGGTTKASFGSDASNDNFYYQVDNHTFQNVASNTTYMKILDSGHVLIGKTTTTVGTQGTRFDSNGHGYFTNSSGSVLHVHDTANYKWYVNANGGVYNYSGNNVNLSDEREKKNISSLSSKWDAVKKWSLKEFHYNSDADSDSKKVGVIAQDLESDHPDLVTEFDLTDTTKRKAIKEQQMTWMAIKALQEAMAKIETLEAKVATLEGG